jgi:hypothetical protein
MRVDEARPPEPSGARACASEIGDEELVRISDDHLLDDPEPVDERADLTTRLPRQLREPPGELGADEAVGGDAALVERLQGLVLTWLQTFGVAKKRLDACSFRVLPVGWGRGNLSTPRGSSNSGLRP